MVVVRVLGGNGSGPDLAVQVAGRNPGSTEPPVLLVHGMGGDHTTWRRLSGALTAAGREVIAVDLRGHGRSGRAQRYRLNDFRDDLAAVLDSLDLDRVDVVGHSLGAHSALRLAMAQPDRVRRLLVEEPPPMPRDDADLAEAITPTSTLAERVRGLAMLAADPRPFLRFDRSMPEVVGVQFEQADPHWWDGLQAVLAPTLVISGGDRSFLPPRHLCSLSEALTRGEFATIDAGHSVHRDRPREFLAAATAYLTAT